jgi:predicted  nucleic acid-binding Zn-ribbon protein
MVVMTPRDHETEHRLDELTLKVDSGFDRLDKDIRELRGEIKALRTELKGEIKALRTELKGEIQELRTELKGEIQELRAEIASLNRTLIAAAVAIVVALIGSNAL